MILARLRAGRSIPGWTVGCAAGPVWEAVRRPTPTSLHVLIGHTLPELAAKLAAAEAQSATDTGPPCPAQAG